MRTLEELRGSASKSALSRQHNIVWMPPCHSESKSTQIGQCLKCQKEVYLCMNPSPNGVDIGGEAISMNCKCK
jgi:hypothetical protein